MTPVYIIFRFKRAVEFPRFSMAKGECWRRVSESRIAPHVEVWEALTGKRDRFSFAGADCLSQDVELLASGNEFDPAWVKYA